MKVMENYRDFEIGPDPFGRTWHVQFKYLQTGISIRHADSVDVCFLLTSGEETLKRVIVLHHPDVLAYTKRKGAILSDTWCSRIAAFKLSLTGLREIPDLGNVRDEINHLVHKHEAFAAEVNPKTSEPCPGPQKYARFGTKS